MKKILISLFLSLFMASGLMAASTLVGSTKIVRVGVTQTATTQDATNGNKVLLPTDGVILVFSNPGATSTTITATDQYTNEQGYSTNASIYVHGGQTVYAGPWKRTRWSDGNGYLQLSYTGLTTTTLTVVRLPIGEPDSQTK